MCTKPSLPGITVTIAPTLLSRIFTTVPSYTLPTSTSAVISSMRFLAASPASDVVAAIVTVPSSSILIFGTGFGSNGADGFAAFTNDFANFIGVDFHGVQTRGMLRQFLRAINGFFHLRQDVQAGFFSLLQRNLHDFFGDALDFDVHLQCGNAFGRTGHFEVHIAQVVFIAQNIG